MVDYCFKFIAYSGLFYAFFHVFMKKDTLFHVHRIYLLGSLLLSLCLPVVSINSWVAAPADSVVLDTLRVGVKQANLQVKSVVWSLEWHESLYAVCSLLLLVRFAWQLFQVFRFIHDAKKEKKGKYTVVYTNGKLPTSSFFNYLLWDDSMKVDDEVSESMLLHEQAHIEERHSVDILLVRLIKVFGWFNPFVYGYEVAIKEQHEYAADATALRRIQLQDYQHALVSVLFKNINPGFVHSFNQCQIRKRIKKMEQLKTSSFSVVKLLGVLPFALGLMLVFQSPQAMAQSDGKVYQLADKAASPEGGMVMLIKGLQKELKYPKEAKKKGIKGRVMVSFIVNTDGTLSDFEVRKGLGHGLDEAAVNALKSLDLSWVPAEKDGKKVRQVLTLPVQFDL